MYTIKNFFVLIDSALDRVYSITHYIIYYITNCVIIIFLSLIFSQRLEVLLHLHLGLQSLVHLHLERDDLVPHFIIEGIINETLLIYFTLLEREGDHFKKFLLLIYCIYNCNNEIVTYSTVFNIVAIKVLFSIFKWSFCLFNTWLFYW